ncbi:MAG TPA: PilZ domain-containing protein [Bryobacteraceae bacterium]|nr:PilZ domain-containing protein [Bryobacteraceae bacterium]
MPVSKPRRREPGERRSGRRYRLALTVEYRFFRHRQIEMGRGSTVNLSSDGILFESASALPVGSKIELSIAWPARLGNSVGLSLAVSGRTVRVHGNLTAVRILGYVFRTRSLSRCADLAKSSVPASCVP